MKKPVLIYGLIAGAIVSGMMLITLPMYNSGALNHENGELTGYTTMVIALSVIFFGVKSYRDKQPTGNITFWKGVQIGLLITLVAGLMYAITWEYLWPRIGNEYMQKFTEQYIANLKAEGLTDAEVTKERDEMTGFMELYKNPLVRIPVTLMEILPVGVIITLITAALMRRKEFLPATKPAKA
jgi:hypothetical protein